MIKISMSFFLFFYTYSTTLRNRCLRSASTVVVQPLNKHYLQLVYAFRLTNRVCFFLRRNHSILFAERASIISGPRVTSQTKILSWNRRTCSAGRWKGKEEKSRSVHYLGQFERAKLDHPIFFDFTSIANAFAVRFPERARCQRSNYAKADTSCRWRFHLTVSEIGVRNLRTVNRAATDPARDRGCDFYVFALSVLSLSQIREPADICFTPILRESAWRRTIAMVDNGTISFAAVFRTEIMHHGAEKQ